jgi:SPX domain protein involved in polyphosphate accumulation
MSINVFKRIEQKYIIPKDKYKILMKEISKYITKDEYFESYISNIYFDNSNNDLIVNSIDKPIYKDKVRLRSYGTPNLNDDIFLEIKNKYKDTVGKRRIKMTLKEFYDYLYEGKYNKESQIMNEINYLFEYYHLKPSIFIAYDRLSYKDKNDDNFRITFDNNLRSRRDDLKLEDGSKGEKFFKKEEYVIMEIKTLGGIPLWFTNALSKLQIYPSSFSKYGEIYKRERMMQFA